MKQKMFRKTEGWMKRNTRPLECSRWACLFEYCTVEDVVEKLSAFQNSDGGFDQGFEPDSMCPSGVTQKKPRMTGGITCRWNSLLIPSTEVKKRVIHITWD